MKKLVHPAELAKASHMRPGDPRIALLTEVSGLKKLERFYNAIEDLHDLDFVEAVFKNLELELEVAEADLAQHSQEGWLGLRVQPSVRRDRWTWHWCMCWAGFART